MLLTGILDDLAQLFKSIYELEFKSKTATSLRVYHQKEKSIFSKEIRKYNEDIADFIENKINKRIINLIYLIRDKVQHQEFIKIERANSYNIEIDEKSSVDLFDLEYFIKKGVLKKENNRDKLFIIPNKYITIIKNDYYDLLSELLNKIDLDKYWSNIDIETQKKIIIDEKVIESGLWNYFKWGEIPYLLEYNCT